MWITIGAILLAGFVPAVLMYQCVDFVEKRKQARSKAQQDQTNSGDEEEDDNPDDRDDGGGGKDPDPDIIGGDGYELAIDCLIRESQLQQV